MTEAITCGEATIKLLNAYGVTTIFGIPGVHTLEFCRGLDKHVTHIQARNEQGAGFMAEGWARATGEPGVALVISGPGVTNATTALAQCHCDKLPMLLLSAEPPSETLGKGWGVLHEITEQKKVTEPITAFSATAMRAADIPGLIARAFSIFNSDVPLPVHISIPIDVQEELIAEDWQPVSLPKRPAVQADQAEAAADLLRTAENPIIMIGGGAFKAAEDLLKIAEATGSVVFNSAAAKGTVPDDHPLCVGSGMCRPEGRELIKQADLVLAIGTELSETDSFVDRLEFDCKIIRVDINPAKLNDLYPCELGLVADAASAAGMIAKALEGHRTNNRKWAEENVTRYRTDVSQKLGKSESQHVKLLTVLDEITPNDTIFSGDACQIMYTAIFAKPMRKPRQFFFPAGYCALGNALPNAIGAKFAKPDAPVAVLVGDGGFMFTMPELLVAAEHKLPIPIVIWDNGGLKQIRDDMATRGVPRVGVDPLNPDFLTLARSCHCDGVHPQSMEEFRQEFTTAFEKDRPTLIVVKEDSDWLL